MFKTSFPLSSSCKEAIFPDHLYSKDEEQGRKASFLLLCCFPWGKKRNEDKSDVRLGIVSLRKPEQESAEVTGHF